MHTAGKSSQLPSTKLQYLEPPSSVLLAGQCLQANGYVSFSGILPAPNSRGPGTQQVSRKGLLWGWTLLWIH